MANNIYHFKSESLFVIVSQYTDAAILLAN